MKFIRHAIWALLWVSAHSAATEATPTKPYKITVWADVLYDTTGHPVQIDFPAKDKYPAKFIQNLQLKLAMSKVEPPIENNLPATFETGVRIELTITPSESGGNVKIDGMYEQPRIIKKAMDKYPSDLLRANWSGDVRVKCLVGLEGKCTVVEIVDSPNLPQSARKFAIGSMNAWRFKLQKINGKPIPYELIVPFSLKAEDPFPPAYFGKYVL